MTTTQAVQAVNGAGEIVSRYIQTVRGGVVVAQAPATAADFAAMPIGLRLTVVT